MIKDENGAIVVNWNDMYDPELVYSFLRDMRYTSVNDTHINSENRFTTIEGDYNSTSSAGTGNFVIIPNEAKYEDKTVRFELIKRIADLAEFPEVDNFLLSHCSYIKDWMDKNPEDKSIELAFKATVSRSDDLGTVTDYLTNVKLTKSIFEDSKRKLELSVLVLAAIIKKFYKSDDKEFEIYNLTTDLQKFNSNNDVILNIMKNPIETLENYDIETSDVNNKVLSYHNGKFSVNFKKFRFLQNIILITPIFEMYRQNLDLKFLSYLITMKKLEPQRSLF
ncbi:MAG TPA: hypothetical protein PLQ22_00785 [Bacilli bacterium]|nr:hypothetical protein [Bacilli bacterium]